MFEQLSSASGVATYLRLDGKFHTRACTCSGSIEENQAKTHALRNVATFLFQDFLRFLGEKYIIAPKLFLKAVHPFIILHDFRAETLKISRLVNYSYYMYIPDMNNIMILVCTMDGYTSKICFTMGRFN